MADLSNIEITLSEYPDAFQWFQVKRRALKTVGLNAVSLGTSTEWRKKMLECRHSPIRRLFFSFTIKNIPSCYATHFARHIHAQPYIRSQRNDRQGEYDREAARQDAPVDMILDCNAEELMVIMNKRLCNMADENTRKIAQMMREKVIEKCPEFEEFLVPMCEYHNGKCHEFKGCGKY